jgi:hypothetical protein
MISKELGERHIIKILGIFGNNVMGMKCISSTFMQMGYILFVE